MVALDSETTEMWPTLRPLGARPVSYSAATRYLITLRAAVLARLL